MSRCGGASRYVGGAVPTVGGVDLPPGWDVLRFGSRRVGCMSDRFAAEPVEGGYILIPVRKGVISRDQCDGLVYPTLMAAIMAAELQKGDASE